MPRLSDTMEEGVIVEWMKKVGDKVAPGDILAEVETDKATMELESFYKGTLLHVAVDKGTVPVDGIIAIIGNEGDNVEEILASASDVPNAPNDEPMAAPEDNQEDQSTSTAGDATASTTHPNVETSTSGRVKASPLAKKMASDAGVDLSSIQGSGENGRIIKRDVEQAVSQPKTARAETRSFPSSGHEDTEVSQMRKIIAKRLGESKFQAPHFYLTMKIDMTDAMSARKQINAMIAPNKVSFNDLIIKCCAVALKKHPEINSSWLGDKIRTNFDVHIGVAVAVDEGLIVPVIPHADRKTLREISSEVKDKATRGRDRKLGLDEMQGNTFTISNLGMFGIDEFTAIINPPDACILAVGGIEPNAVVVDGEVVIRNIMKITLSCDHRVVDGAKGSQFLQTLKSLLEAPVRILA